MVGICQKMKNLKRWVPAFRHATAIRKKDVHNTRFSRDALSCSQFPTDIIQAYGDWIHVHLSQGWDGYLFTFMFQHLAGSADAKIRQMEQDITQVYQRLLTRTVRNPRSPLWQPFLPNGIFFPDRAGYRGSKRFNNSISDVSINDGIHVHGVILTHRWGRLQEPLDVHFAEHWDRYHIGKIRRIHIEPITHEVVRTTDYAGKAVKRRDFSTERILVLPQSVSELPDKKPRPLGTSQERLVKDLQSSWNVSDEVAQDICSALTSPKTR